MLDLTTEERAAFQKASKTAQLLSRMSAQYEFLFAAGVEYEQAKNREEIDRLKKKLDLFAHVAEKNIRRPTEV